jgi:Na+/H+-dicarboxylate symporter
VKEIALLIVCTFLLCPIANAGPLDSALGGLIGATPAYWLEAVALISAVLGLVSALVKDSSLPPWLATGLNLLASNWGKAKNGEN